MTGRHSPYETPLRNDYWVDHWNRISTRTKGTQKPNRTRITSKESRGNYRNSRKSKMGSSPVEVAGRARVLGENAALYSSLPSGRQQLCPRLQAKKQKFERRRNHGGVGTFIGVRLSFTKLTQVKDGRVTSPVSLPCGGRLGGPLRDLPDAAVLPPERQVDTLAHE